MDSVRHDTTPGQTSVPTDAPAAPRDARPGGLAVGEEYVHEDGLKIRVDRLWLLPQVPPKNFLEERDEYLSAAAARFEVTVTNDGEKAQSVSDLSIDVRSGADGRRADESWNGTRPLRGKLLPGASATGTYTYRMLAGTTGEIDILIARGPYHSDEKTQQVWTGAAGQGRDDGTESADGGLSQERRDELFAAAMRELDAMTGLVPVKKRVRMLGAQARMAAARVRLGLPDAGAAHHLVFTGPPGTGKTAVARLLGKLLAGVGVLERGHVVEANRSELIGGYLGQTAIKTNQLIDKAIGGVLFIDEACGLHGGYGGKADAFGDEALQVLLKRAEDDRHRLVVILAGYRAEMSRMLCSNPGLASRFATRVDFPSYDCDELLSIARAMLAGADTVEAKADAELRRICAIVADNQWQDALGNGRFVRTPAENARACRDLRLAERYGQSDPPAVQLTRLAAADFKTAFADIQAGHGLRARSAIA